MGEPHLLPLQPKRRLRPRKPALLKRPRILSPISPPAPRRGIHELGGLAWPVPLLLSVRAGAVCTSSDATGGPHPAIVPGLDCIVLDGRRPTSRRSRSGLVRRPPTGCFSGAGSRTARPGAFAGEPHHRSRAPENPFQAAVPAIPHRARGTGFLPGRGAGDRRLDGASSSESSAMDSMRHGSSDLGAGGHSSGARKTRVSRPATAGPRGAGPGGGKEANSRRTPAASSGDRFPYIESRYARETIAAFCSPGDALATAIMTRPGS